MTARPSAKSDIRTPFMPEVLRRAQTIADAYDLILRYEDGEWCGHALEYPEAMGDGKTPEACIRATRQALTARIATMLEAGQTPPSPARQGLRTEQVNVRLTAEEKALLEKKAKGRGFRGLSDFIRASVLIQQ